MDGKFVKYTWVGNRISEDDMHKLYLIKQDTRKPITQLVAEAVRKFVKDTEDMAVTTSSGILTPNCEERS